VADSELSASRQRHHAAGRHSGEVVTAAKGRNVVSPTALNKNAVPRTATAQTNRVSWEDGAMVGAVSIMTTSGARTGH
jgi:hypothetical protein